VNSIDLISEAILDRFADLVHNNRNRLYRLWIVTPWLGYDDNRDDPLYVLIDSLKKTSCTVTLITRPPNADWHKRAVKLLEKGIRPITYHCESLHTKLYVLECNGFRATILGSPNLTPNANKRNKELAIQLCTTEKDRNNKIVKIVNSLIAYASTLPGEAGVSLA